MKRTICIFLILLPIVLWAQKKDFTITGKLKNSPVDGPYVYLLFAKNGQNVLDSTKITNNEYVFKGELTQPGPATIFSVSPRLPASRGAQTHVSIYLEPLQFGITHIDSFSNIVTDGSPANTEFAKLKKQLAPLIAAEQSLGMRYRAARAAGDSVAASKLAPQLDSLDHSINKGVLCPYVKNNPASPIALFVLESAFPGEMDPVSAGPLFERLSASLKNSSEGIDFRKRLDMARVTAIGEVAPDFTQPDTLGRPVSLASFRGGYVLVDFWASWCGPCRMENPNVVAAYGKFQPKGFRIVGVSLDKPGAKDKWLAAIRQDGLTWTQVSDLQFWNNAAAKLYGVNGIPQNFLLDPNGRIIAKNLRGTDLELKLEEIYK